MTRSVFQSRIIVGVSIAVLATVLGIFLVPAVLTAYSIWFVLAAALLIIAYAIYLAMIEPPRLPVLLRGYLEAYALILAVPLVLPLLEWSKANAAFGNVIVLFPVLAMFGAVVRTHLAGMVPDIVVARKDF